MLARVIGGEHFYPIAEEWIKISLVWFGMLWGGGLTGGGGGAIWWESGADWWGRWV